MMLSSGLIRKDSQQASRRIVAGTLRWLEPQADGVNGELGAARDLQDLLLPDERSGVGPIREQNDRPPPNSRSTIRRFAIAVNELKSALRSAVAPWVWIRRMAPFKRSRSFVKSWRTSRRSLNWLTRARS